jgi:hypothetical protein
MLITSTRLFMDSPSSFYYRGALSITSIVFSMPFPLYFFFFRIETLGRNHVSTTSLRDDDLVKGFLTFLLAVGEGEEKCNFLPFLVVALVDEGTSSNFGAAEDVKSLSVVNDKPPSLFIQFP